MIQNTFQILERVGEGKEQSLWKQGIHSWDSFLGSSEIKGFPSEKKAYFDRSLLAAKRALHLGDSAFFLNKLPTTETWRLWPLFKDEAVFLDIETDGLNDQAGVTVIGLFDGLRTKTMIRGINLDFSTLKAELSQYKLIITFNGSSFDLPFLRKRTDILPPIPHIDLRHCCARIGLTGGLKEIEKQLGIRRSEIVEKMYGGDALTLWRMYRGSGDDRYLNLLVEYNEEDCVNLQKLMGVCYGRLEAQLRGALSSSKTESLLIPETKEIRGEV
ncbi:MAG: ribonuclease H-like domain-containing protein [Nanoarchaeota archaeon]|nr:ribonuclease H-like domain-containing protein [Nanoarchaeota archaeon]